MKHVRLRLSAGGREDEVHPMYDVVANAEFVGYATALNWNYAGDELGILHYVEGDADRFEAAMRSIPEVLAYDLHRIDEDSFYVYIRDATTESIRALFGVVDRSSLVTIPPIEYHPDGPVTFSVFGPGDQIQAAIESVPDPVAVTVEEITGLQAIPHTVPSALSDRQREAVEAALAVGYYDVPRRGSQADVAERLGCASSTAAEHLRKAESKVLHALFG